MISIIIPIYNRRDHLYLTLMALDCQGFRGFEVIVVDDGSTDHPELAVAHFQRLLDIQMCSHPHEGFGANKCRNEGAALAKYDALLFLDSSILLNMNAMEHFRNLHQSNPDALLGGRYDWLPPMKITPADIVGNWEAIAEARLPHSRTWNRLELEGIIGIDPREKKHPGMFDWRRGAISNYCLELYGANLLVPKYIYESLGGFDERMTRPGGEDCEFAIRAQAAGHRAVFADEMIGYHMYHERNQEQNAQDVLVNIQYIRQKHDLRALGIVDGEDEQLPLIREEAE